ncbi:molybdate ABC transporter substrate-binding protein [Hydrogenovibrio sp. JE_KL2]|uniref:molybdate ABC transporter substrate-binding protein n=1 Tax=Hydrogenovibrio sp. JE_KL2 TaxID=2651188 RepID=UPI00128C7DA7|nr:molybdate ABC transporter substrate-binding protein [Hydrogenovibrio sp. JE_KL2]MPQ76594.1 molybdate ABC transporter substrate-binding protein [Hydrogenovibrio sp. JE_KL2]
MNRRNVAIVSISTLVLLILSIFEMVTHQAPHASTHNKSPDLVIYAGITMVKPLKVLVDAFEKQHHVNIEINQGASGFLYQTIQKEKKGDIYFPGSDSYRKIGEKEGLILDHVLVGYNRVALVVAKGNPKHLTNDLNQLTNSKLSVVLSSPTSGAIGKAGDAMLKKAGIAEKVYKNVTYFTTDSHRLFHAIKSGDADIVINWYAVTKWPQTKDYLTVIPIDPKWSKPKKLELDLLSYSKNPTLAKAFMAYAASKTGVQVFYDYGFFTQQEYEQRMKELDAGDQAK